MDLAISIGADFADNGRRLEEIDEIAAMAQI